MSKQFSVSIVVPVYNGAKTIRTLLERIVAILPRVASEHEVIFVNDGSRDDSWAVIQQLCNEFPCVSGINLNRNYGQHNALLAGIRHARYEVIVTMDDDLQNPPEEIPRLVERLESGADVVYGAPRNQEHGLFRNMASRLTKVVLRSMMNVEAASSASSYRAFRTHLRDAFVNFTSPHAKIDVMLCWGTSRFDAIKVDHYPRTSGKSNYTLGKLLLHAVDITTGYTTIPLRIATLIGFLFMLFGVAIIAYVLVHFIVFGRSVPGFTFIASVITIFSGVQLFWLGVIGEYIGRIHQRLMEQPPYVIRECTGKLLGPTEDPNGIERPVSAVR